MIGVRHNRAPNFSCPEVISVHQGISMFHHVCQYASFIPRNPNKSLTDPKTWCPGNPLWTGYLSQTYYFAPWDEEM